MQFKNRLERFFLSLKPVLFFCLHLGLLFSVYQLLHLHSFVKGFDLNSLKQWDANFYADIAENGYQYSSTQASNTAFFPFFPYVWKLINVVMGLGVEAVCFFNTTVFFAGMLLLKNAFKFSWSYFLVFVSFPSNMFMYIPYTEATFFFFSAMVLAGLKTNKKSMIVTGLFFASVTRPSAAFLIPAIIGMELFAYSNLKTFVKNSITYSILPLVALLLVLLFQSKATGVWLSFFKAQAIGWQRVPQWPEFPLTTWGRFENIWLDGLAFFFGLLALVMLFVLVGKKLKAGKSLEIEKAKSFSLIYLVLALFTILFFSGKDAEGGTTILSLNRILMATPYFTVMLYLISHYYKLNFISSVVYVSIAVIAISLVNLHPILYTYYSEEAMLVYGLCMFGLMLLYATISSGLIIDLWLWFTL